jgi:hypothetical protein
MEIKKEKALSVGPGRSDLTRYGFPSDILKGLKAPESGHNAQPVPFFFLKDRRVLQTDGLKGMD